VDDAFEEVKDVAGVVVLAAPVVGIVFDAAFAVDGDLIAVDQPVESRFSVDDVVLSRFRDVAEGNVLVVDDSSFVETFANGFLFGSRTGVAHAIDFVEVPGIEVELGRFLADFGGGLEGFVIEVEFGELTAGGSEGGEIGFLSCQRNPGEHFFKVG